MIFINISEKCFFSLCGFNTQPKIKQYTVIVTLHCGRQESTQIIKLRYCARCFEFLLNNKKFIFFYYISLYDIWSCEFSMYKEMICVIEENSDFFLSLLSMVIICQVCVFSVKIVKMWEKGNIEINYSCSNLICSSIWNEIPGHCSVPHLVVWVVWPVHEAPPYCGGIHVRFLLFRPSQVALHWLQDPQSLSRPSTMWINI